MFYLQNKMQSLVCPQVTLLFVSSALAFTTFGSGSVRGDDLGQPGQSLALARVTEHIRYLASDELKGRQPGTPEMKLAEDYIVNAYREAGLKPITDDGSYFQTFDAGAQSRSREIDIASTSMAFTGPDGNELKFELDQQYVQLIYRGAVDLQEVPMVFVGYGIDAGKEHNYNEYADIDVDGKVVVLIRREPQQDDPNSVFNGDEISRYAYLQTKVRSAMDNGAAAIMMVNDSHTLQQNEGDDNLPRPEQFGRVSQLIPFVHAKRASFDAMLEQTPIITFDGDELTSLEAVEDRIDGSLEPLSQSMPGWKANIKGTFIKKKIDTHNIIGVVEGEGPFANETIVIGAHYDHLGMGAYGSRSPQAGKDIHNGADDNATGTAAVIELGRRFAAGKPPQRRLVFICFTAEEMGLLGAQHYVENPLFPIEDTVAMINFDMIGYLRLDAVTVFGWNSSPAFNDVLKEANTNHNFSLVRPPSGFAGSDHLPFNRKKIPNLFFTTGLTQVYHTPEDDFEAIDCAGSVRVIDFTASVVEGIANSEERPRYRRTGRTTTATKLGVSFGDGDADGIKISRVLADTPADKAGIKAGDVLVSWNGNEELSKRRQVIRLIKRDAGEEVNLKLSRDGEELLMTIQLDE